MDGRTGTGIGSLRTSCHGRLYVAGLAVLVGPLLLALPIQAFALNGENHRDITQKALDILLETEPEMWQAYASCTGQCQDLPPAPGALRKYNPAYAYMPWNVKLIREAADVDGYRDLEFVDVEGVGQGRDDPHRDDPWYAALDDGAHYTEDGHCLTAFNHFIDIKKGPGLFDDYDGYAYHKGSARWGQYQDASDATSGFWATVLAKITGYKVDAGLVGYWFNDEYVHAPCHQWYRGCSPSVQRYSFPTDKGVYATVHDELAARFPLARSTGSSGKGIPYSVFMPVDNMARYWYGRFLETEEPQTLGPVLHAIQDASVPHHAAGYNGNWHGRYETEAEFKIKNWLNEHRFLTNVNNLVALWTWNDPTPPTTLPQHAYTRRPGINWRIDQLVTWVALNAYREYDAVYNHFRDDYEFVDSSAKRLTELATAMTILALKKGAMDMGVGEGPALELATSQMSFTLAATYGANERLGFRITQRGPVTIEATWSGGSGDIPLLVTLKAPQAAGPCLRETAESPLTAEHQVTEDDIAQQEAAGQGDIWRVQISNLSRRGPVTGTLRVTYPKPATVTSEKPFNLSDALGDREALEFSVTEPGPIVLEATWTGAPRLALILNGPGQTGYYARQDGSSPLTVEYEVTAQDVATGDTWRASVVNFSRQGPVPGVLKVTYPKPVLRPIGSGPVLRPAQ